MSLIVLSFIALLMLCGAGAQFGVELTTETIQSNPYSFGYTVQDDYGNRQHRTEYGDENGAKRGSYGYKDANGVYRKVDYIADENGYRVLSLRSNEPGLTDAEMVERAPSGSNELQRRSGSEKPEMILEHSGRSVELKYPEQGPASAENQQQDAQQLVTAATRTDYSMPVRDYPLNPAWAVLPDPIDNSVDAETLKLRSAASQTTPSLYKPQQLRKEQTRKPDYDKSAALYLNPFLRLNKVDYRPKLRSQFNNPNPFEVLGNSADLGTDTTTTAAESWSPSTVSERIRAWTISTSTTTTPAPTTTERPKPKRVHATERVHSIPITKDQWLQIAKYSHYPDMSPTPLNQKFIGPMPRPNNYPEPQQFSPTPKQSKAYIASTEPSNEIDRETEPPRKLTTRPRGFQGTVDEDTMRPTPAGYTVRDTETEAEPFTTSTYRSDLPYGARLSTYKKLTTGLWTMASEKMGFRTVPPLVTSDLTTMSSLQNMTKAERMRSIINLKTPTLPERTDRTSREYISDRKFKLNRYGEQAPVRTFTHRVSMTPAVDYAEEGSDVELTTAAYTDLKRKPQETTETGSRITKKRLTNSGRNHKKKTEPAPTKASVPKSSESTENHSEQKYSKLEKLLARIEESEPDPTPTRPRRPRGSAADISVLTHPPGKSFQLAEKPTDVNGHTWPYRYNIIGF